MYVCIYVYRWCYVERPQLNFFLILILFDSVILFQKILQSLKNKIWKKKFELAIFYMTPTICTYVYMYVCSMYRLSTSKQRDFKQSPPVLSALACTLFQKPTATTNLNKIKDELLKCGWFFFAFYRLYLF